MLGQRRRRWPNIEPALELLYTGFVMIGLGQIIIVFSCKTSQRLARVNKTVILLSEGLSGV